MVNHLDVVVCVSVTHSASTTTPAAQTTSSTAVRAKNHKTISFRNECDFIIMSLRPLSFMRFEYGQEFFSVKFKVLAVLN